MPDCEDPEVEQPEEEQSCPACMGDPYSRHNHETWEDLYPARDTGFERGRW